jgi:hypothetical protein
VDFDAVTGFSLRDSIAVLSAVVVQPTMATAMPARINMLIGFIWLLIFLRLLLGHFPLIQ